MKWFDFSKEGDEFIKKLITIVDNEKIEIFGYENRNNYWFFVDDKKYQFEYDGSYYNLNISDKKSDKFETDVKVSKKYWRHFDNIFKEQQKKLKIKNLPDLSEVARAAKKYNL